MENLNAEQIKKALECCHKESIVLCRECPYSKEYDYNEFFCTNKLMKDALDLIKSQEQDKEKLGLLISEIEKEKQKLFEENKRLTEENERLQKALNTDISFVRVSRGNGKTARLREVGRIKVDSIRADTVRKMLQRIKEDAVSVSLLSNPPKFMLEIREDALDQIAKEMLESDDG